jgi:hypothetical protein
MLLQKPFIEIKGIEWYGEYTSSGAVPSLQELKDEIKNTNYISINFRVNVDGDVVSRTTSIEASRREAIRRAKDAGFKVNVRVKTDLDNHISYHPSNVQLFFQTYTDSVVEWAKIAEELNVDIFCIGGELTKLEQYNEEWKNMIQKIRSVYSGKISYNTNMWHTNEPREGYLGESLKEKLSYTWFQKLDYIAVSTYWTGSQTPEPTVEQLVYNWHHNAISWGDAIGDDIVDEHLKVLSETHGKPIIIVTGLASAYGASKTPWKDFNPEDNPIISLTEQENWYDAIFRVFSNESWVSGVLFDTAWSCYPNFSPNNYEFPIQNKPAEKVVADWFEKLS